MKIQRPSEDTLIRYFKGECLPQENELVILYLALDVDHSYVSDCMKTAWLTSQEYAQSQLGDAELNEFGERFHARKANLDQLPPLENGHSVQKSSHWFSVWIKVAAAVLILIGSTLLFYNYNHQNQSSDFTYNQQEILPGSNKATLTLADGSMVSLADQPAGQLAVDEGLVVQKTKGGEIIYSTAKEVTASSNAINTISTPNGGQYQVTLPDGTKAWLNAASSLSYPLHFNKGERKVKMTGEVYFEVAKYVVSSTGKSAPFLVETDRQQIQVLGTHFNVNAYKDEPNVRTTLLEGSVKINSRDGKSIFLKPGQLAVLGEQLTVVRADIDQEMAWKNGDFIFKGETLEGALRQISRWYNVEIECAEKLGKLRFNGMISRKQPLSTIIEMIQLTKLAKITVKERRLIVAD